MAQNFFGRDPMKWWIGQVTDPEKGKWDKCLESYSTKTGEDIYAWRCRVRIVGYHDNADDLPDEDLPLAHVLLPPGVSTTGGQGMTCEYQGGEVVVGFFADGEDAQQPIVFGTLFKQTYLSDQVSTGLFNKQNQVDFVPWTPPKVVQSMGPHQINETTVPPDGSVTDTNVTGATSQDGGGSGIGSPDGGPPATTGGGDGNKGKDVKRTSDPRHKTLTEQNNSVATDNVTPNPNPCKPNEVTRIKVALGEFKDKVQALKKIADFDKHIDPTFGTTFNMEEETKLVVGKVHDATTSIIRRTRAYTVQDTLGKLKKELQEKTAKTLQGATGEASQQLIDVVFCNFEKIQAGMLDYLAESIGNLADQALDVPQCAVESFLGDMFGQVGNILDSQMGDLFGSLGNITGGAIGGMGGMPSDLFDKGLMFADMAEQILECDGIKCDQPTNFSTRNGTFTGVTDDMKNIMLEAALKRLPSSEGTTAPNCDSNILKCGPPKLDFMGGGGKGLSAKAVINATGQLIGASIFNSGYGFKRPPALNFVDSCDNGYGSSVYPDLGPVSSIDNPNVAVNAAGGVFLFSEDGCPITVGGNGGINVTLPDGQTMVTNVGPMKACASGGLAGSAGGMGGTLLSNETCGMITVGGEGGIPLLVGDTPLVLGEFPITCGGISRIKDNLITLPNGQKVDTYYEAACGELSSDHWDKDGVFGTGPSVKELTELNILLKKGIPVSECLTITNGGQDYGEVFIPGTMGKVVQITPLISAGVNYGGSLTKINLPTIGGTGKGLTIDVELVPIPSSVKRKPNGNVAVSAGVELIVDPADPTGPPIKIPTDEPPYPVKTGEDLVLEFGITELAPTTGAVKSIKINKQGTGYKAQDIITIPNLTILDAVVDKEKGNKPATFKVKSIKPPTGGELNIPLSGGSGTGLSINYDSIDGVIDTVLVNNSGSGYQTGDVLSVPGGDGTGRIAITCLETKMSGESVAAGESICDIKRYVEKSNIYVPDPYGKELGVVDVIVVDPGSSFLPNTVVSELDIDPTSPTFGQTTTKEVKPSPDESYDGESSYITSLGKVKVKNAGMGYSDGDTCTVVSDGGTGGADGGTGGAEVKLNIQDGFIVNAEVTSSGSGFTSLPELQINSDSGVGGRLLPVLKFTKVADAKKTLTKLPKNIEVVTVIDCVQQ